MAGGIPGLAGGFRLANSVASFYSRFAAERQALHLLVKVEQSAPFGTNDLQLVQNRLEQTLLFMLLGGIPLQKIEGRVVLFTESGVHQGIELGGDMAFMVVDFLNTSSMDSNLVGGASMAPSLARAPVSLT